MDMENIYLSIEEVLRIGTEFSGDVCWSGEYYDQVYTKDQSEGGIPFEGILYERYKNGNLCYYAFYKDGMPNGREVWFYESGTLKSDCVMDGGAIAGEYTSWYENGNVKEKKYCRYGVIFWYKSYDEDGQLTKEKTEPTEQEKERYLHFREIYQSIPVEAPVKAPIARFFAYEK